MSKELSNFGELLNKAGSGVPVKAITLVNQNPEIAAVISKLVRPVNNTVETAGKNNKTSAGIANFQKSSNNVATNIRDAQTVIQMLPDMELPMQILVSSIISPKDMMSTEITYSSGSDEIPPDVMSSLIEEAKKYFEGDYKIIPMLPKILESTLFKTGSFATAVIPENAIDDIINNSGAENGANITLESFSHSFTNNGNIKNIGLLGPSTTDVAATAQTVGLSLEYFKNNVNKEYDTKVKSEVDLNISVTDNFDILKIPSIKQVLRERKVMSATKSPALEAFNNRLTDLGLTNSIYKNNRQGYVPIISVKTKDQLNRKSVGNPLIINLPSESVLNVFVPGSPEKHLGHFVMIDQDGYPISTSTQINLYSELSSQRSDMASSLLNQAKNTFGLGEQELNVEQQSKYMTQLYADVVEKDLLSRLRNGVYGDGVEIANNEQIYRIMLSRSLAHKHTQLLFIPGEQMTYFAFKYNSDGTGKSLLDDMKMINSLRAALMLSDVHSSLRNSIGSTNIEVKLDADDPNPQKTIEESITEIARTRSNLLPLGMNDPTDIVNWLGRSSFQVAFSGHPSVPDIGFTTNQVNSNYIKPDSDLSEQLRKQTIMGLKLNPAVVDATYEAEFATAIVTNNLLLAKTVQQFQDQFVPQLSDHLRKVIINSEVIIKRLRDVITNNIDSIIEKVKEGDANLEITDQNKAIFIDKVLVDFITNFNISLPTPNTSTLTNQVEALKQYKEALDEAIDAWIGDSWFTTDTAGEVANNVGVVKEIVKAYYIRKWMAENGVLTELSKLTMVNKQGKPEMNFYEENLKHIDSLSLSLSSLMAGLVPIKERGNKVNEAIGGSEESTTTDNNESSDNTNDGEDGGLDGMDLGSDDLGGSTDDVGGADANAKDTPAEDAKDKSEEEKKDDTKEPNLNGDVPE